MNDLPAKLDFSPGNIMSFFLLQLLRPREATMAQAEPEGSLMSISAVLPMNNFDVMVERRWNKIEIHYPRDHNPRSIKCLCETPIVKTPLYFSLFFHFLFIYTGGGGRGP